MTVTYGVRVDLPIFPDKPTRNEFSEPTFGYGTDIVPSSQLWSPRVGFNYDLHGDGRAQVRAGIGLFTGRTPYVWLSNQYGNTGNEFARLRSRTMRPTGSPLSPIRTASRSRWRAPGCWATRST